LEKYLLIKEHLYWQYYNHVKPLGRYEIILHGDRDDRVPRMLLVVTRQRCSELSSQTQCTTAWSMHCLSYYPRYGAQRIR